MTDLSTSLDKIVVLSKDMGRSKELRRILDIVERLRTEEFNKSMWNRKSVMAALRIRNYN